MIPLKDVSAMTGGEHMTNEFEFGYKVFWEGTELVSYWGFYLPSEIQDAGTALENIANDRTAIVAKKDWEAVKRLAREQNSEVATR